TQEFQPLRRQLIAEKIDPRQIAALPIEAGDEAQPDRVFAGAEDDRDRRRCRLGCECRGGTSGRNHYRYLPANQFGRQRRQPLELPLSPAIFDRHVLALDIAAVLEALAECAHTVRKRVGDVPPRNPITGMAGCCARAASGHAAAAPPSSVMNVRRFTRSPRRRPREACWGQSGRAPWLS